MSALHNTPDLYFWRSHDQTEVDLIMEHKGVIYPIEIKKTSTPTARHSIPLDRFRSFAKHRNIARGMVVCTFESSVALTRNTVAIPWKEYLRWLTGI